MLQRVHLALEFLGLLKLFSPCGNEHLFIERFYQLFLLAFKQKYDVPDIAPVLLFCDCAAAYARTQPYLCAEARPLLPKSTSISVRKNLSNEPHCFQKLEAVRKGAEYFFSFGRFFQIFSPNNQYSWIFFICNQYIIKTLIVF